jgi:hypothetical protein
MKMKKSNIVLLIVALLYFSYATVNYFMAKQFARQMVEKYSGVEQ